MERRLRTPHALRQAEDSTADGSFTRYDLGRSHYLNQYAIHVSAAILRPGNELLVVRQLDRGLKRIDLPGGVPHFNETLQRALVREVWEETGFRTVPTEIAFVAEGQSERWPDPTLEICFYGQIQARTDPPDRTGEHILSVEWLALDDPELLRFIPHVAEFRSSKRGRYVDLTATTDRGARQHSGVP
jgi:8-oxo-dGTP pyrophosphatase MutT (NUDIX family)